MFVIDKAAFGAFITDRRKAKGCTQRELAALLFVSDKAISKWERGLSLPDITLLMPLSKALDVTVSELLECKIIDSGGALDASQVETIVQKALTFSQLPPEQRRKKTIKKLVTFGVCTLLSALELAAGYLLSLPCSNSEQLIVMVLLSFIFGIYFWFFTRDRLPAYYDENRIGSYSDGIFRLNIPGISYNNSNWPYIVKVGRLWSAITLPVVPFIMALLPLCPPSMGTIPEKVLVCLYLAGLFVPIYAIGKKYQ